MNVSLYGNTALSRGFCVILRNICVCFDFEIHLFAENKLKKEEETETLTLLQFFVKFLKDLTNACQNIHKWPRIHKIRSLILQISEADFCQFFTNYTSSTLNFDKFQQLSKN